MFQFLVLLVVNSTQYNATEAHEDSLFIYNAYSESARFFEQATEPGQWKAVNDSVSLITAEAFARLHKYNHSKYIAIDELNREAVGVALIFPQPSKLSSTDVAKPGDLKADANQGASETSGSGKEIAFKVLDEQTHFLIGPNGKGRIPYITMNYYAKGRILIRSEKLNPVTHLPIQVQTEAAGLATSSN